MKQVIIFCLLLTITLSTAKAEYSLTDLYQLASKNDTIFHASKSRYEAEQLNPSIARADILPQLSLNFSKNRTFNHEISGTFFSRNNVSDSSSKFSPYNTDTFALNLSQTLFDQAKFVKLKQSKSLEKFAEFQWKSAQQDLILRLAEAYFSVLSAQSKLQFIVAEKDAIALQLQQTNKRFELGTMSITDTKEAQAAFDLASADEIAANNERITSLHKLAVIVNRDVQVIMPLRKDFQAQMPEPHDIEKWIVMAQNKNLEILAQQIAVNIAEQEIELQKAQHYPLLNLAASHNISKVSGGPSPREANDYQVGLTISLPLFAGGRTHYQSEHAIKLYDETLHKREKTYRETKQQIRETYLKITAGIKRIQALLRAQESTQSAVESIRAGFSIGIRTSAEVLIGIRDLFRTKRDYTLEQYNYILNLFRLKKAAGTLSAKDIQVINGWLQSDTL